MFGERKKIQELEQTIVALNEKIEVTNGLNKDLMEKNAWMSQRLEWYENPKRDERGRFVKRT